MKSCYTSIKSKKKRFSVIDAEPSDVPYAEINVRKQQKPNRKQGGTPFFQFALLNFF